MLEGSANINQRSQDGERDTEIAMGGFQPNFRPQGRGVVRTKPSLFKPFPRMKYTLFCARHLGCDVRLPAQLPNP